MPDSLSHRGFLGSAGGADTLDAAVEGGEIQELDPKEELLTPESRQLWLAWRANRGKDDDWIGAAGRFAAHDGREAALRDTAFLYQRSQ